jgi:hypothetical protein
MKLVSTLAVAASVVAAGALAAPAVAQGSAKSGAAAKQPERKYKISKEAQKPLADLQAAVTAKRTENFATLLAAAEAVAKNSDEKYLVAHFRLQHAKNISDMEAARAAIESIIASGGADATEVAEHQRVLLTLSAQGGDPKAAEQLYERTLAANPNDLDALSGLARAKIELKKDTEALSLLQRAIAASKADGKPVPESWYRMSLRIAHAQNNKPLALQMAREALSLNPSKENLQNLIAIHSGPSTQDKQATIDYYRLLRQTRFLNASGYEQLAFLLNESGLPGEAKSVIEEGRRLGTLKGSAGAQILSSASGRVAEDRASLPGAEAKARSAATGAMALRTADAFMGYGDYSKAAELLRLALSKGGVDSNLVNTRLGIALALAGRKAEASTALRAVTGARADLASLWLAWLAQPS